MCTKKGETTHIVIDSFIKKTTSSADTGRRYQPLLVLRLRICFVLMVGSRTKHHQQAGDSIYPFLVGVLDQALAPASLDIGGSTLFKAPRDRRAIMKKKM